jgi:hypothetical protein
MQISKSFLWTAVILCLLGIPTLKAVASTGHSTVASYSVSSRGFRIGSVTTTQTTSLEDGVPTIRFETKTSIKASLFWIGYHLETTEKGTLKNGSLVSYSRHGEENGQKLDVEGRLDETAFRFTIWEPSGARAVIVPRNSYENTTMECPEARLDFTGRNSATLRVLDVENFAVVKREYRYIRDSQYTISGRDYPCRIIDFSDQHKSARRWIQQENGSVFMYRQDGRGDRSSYSAMATAIKREP